MGVHRCNAVHEADRKTLTVLTVLMLRGKQPMVATDGGRSTDVSIVVIDDHDVVHAGLQTWCENVDPPIRIVDGYYSVDKFLINHPQAAGDVDVVVLDVELSSGQPDFAAVQRVCAAGYRVIVYSRIAADAVITTCLDMGAATYLVRSEGRWHLVEAIRAARHDTPYIGPRMAAAMRNDARRLRPDLAPREKEVLVAWFQSESKDLVGRRLFIAPTTVRTHLQRIRAKYAAAGRPAITKAALVARAIQDGIVSIDDL